MRLSCFISLCALGATTAAITPRPCLAQPNSFTVLDSAIAVQPSESATLGTLSVVARGISGNGQVIFGSSAHATARMPVINERPFAWVNQNGAWVRQELPTSLPIPPTAIRYRGRALVASYDGNVIGGFGPSVSSPLTSSASNGVPTLWNGVLTGAPSQTQPVPGVSATLGYVGGISSSGSAVASSWTQSRTFTSFSGVNSSAVPISPLGSGDVSYTVGHPLIGGAMSGDGSVIVGTRSTGMGSPEGPSRAIVYGGNASYTALPIPAVWSSAGSEAVAVSRDGTTIIGNLHDASRGSLNSATMPVVWRNGEMHTLMRPMGAAFPSGFLPSQYPYLSGWALSLSGDGAVIGGTVRNYLAPGPAAHFEFGTFRGSDATLWLNDQFMLLSDLLTSLNISFDGYVLNAVTGVSDDGRVLTGVAHLASDPLNGPAVSFVVTIPAPGTAIATAGFAALVCWRSPRKGRR